MDLNGVFFIMQHHKLNIFFLLSVGKCIFESNFWEMSVAVGICSPFVYFDFPTNKIFGSRFSAAVQRILTHTL